MEILEKAMIPSWLILMSITAYMIVTQTWQLTNVNNDLVTKVLQISMLINVVIAILLPIIATNIGRTANPFNAIGSMVAMAIGCVVINVMANVLLPLTTTFNIGLITQVIQLVCSLLAITFALILPTMVAIGETTIVNI